MMDNERFDAEQVLMDAIESEIEGFEKKYRVAVLSINIDRERSASNITGEFKGIDIKTAPLFITQDDLFELTKLKPDDPG